MVMNTGFNSSRKHCFVVNGETIFYLFDHNMKACLHIPVFWDLSDRFMTFIGEICDFLWVLGSGGSE